MEHAIDPPADTAGPRVMQSTPGTLTLTRDGRTTTTEVRIVHPAGITPPTTITHTCTDACGRPA